MSKISRLFQPMWVIVAVLLIATACVPNPTVPPTPTKTPIVYVEPTATTVPTQSVPTAAPTKVPTQANESQPASKTVTSPEPEAAAVTEGSPTVPPPPPIDSELPPENYCMSRPIPPGWQDYLDRTYPYGNTSGGQYLPHNGGDFPNPVSTPVVAVGDGTVLFAGEDTEELYGPQLNFYGILIVLKLDTCPYNGRPIYVLYGHLSEVSVEAGQRVSDGETIGAVGGTGVAAGGAHLHFEVRVDDPRDYFTSTRNPDLWIQPYAGFGTLAGRVTDSDGNYLRDVTIRIDRRNSDNLPRYAYTYTSSENRPDDAWGENFTYGDLPEGWYTVSTGSGAYSQEIYIRPGETSWVEFVFD